MQNTVKDLQQILKEAVQSAGFDVSDETIELSPTKTLEHGHLATNIALIIGKKAGLNPRETAQKIADKLQNKEGIEKVEIAGPGFINLFIEQKFYSNFCRLMSQNLDEYIKKELPDSGGKKVVIEYSSPNIAKPLGVHHLLSTIIGDSLNRIYKRLGNKTIAENYPGDMGTQFGKLIYAIKKWGDFKQIEKDPINELLKLYVKFHKEAEIEPEEDIVEVVEGLSPVSFKSRKEDEVLLNEARAEYKKFEEGDVENREMWQQIVDWSMQEIQPLYDRMGIHFDGVHGESFFEDKMQIILDEGIKKGIFIEGEKGSLIMKTDHPDEPPAVVKKSDGTTLYLTRDLAQMAFFEKEYQPDMMIWAVDVAQSLHFRHRFEAARKLEISKAEFKHVEFGRMQFKDGSMSTRKGNMIRLAEVLDEAEERSLALIQQKGADLSEEEQKELAQIMGVGSVKYNILHQNRVQNMTFEWDKMLAFEGNSAPYLMYTVARAKSLIRKSELNTSDIIQSELRLSGEEELKVVLALLKYADALRRAKEEFRPNHIANFLYQLAQDFNRFYNAVPILQADDHLKRSRLLLVYSVIRVMEDGLSLLAIKAPEKM